MYFWQGHSSPCASNSTRATKPLRTVHCDLWGPARTPTIGGATYFLTCYDDYNIQLTGTPPPLKRFNTELRVFEDVLDTEETEELPVIPINPPEEQAPPPVRRNPPRNARPEQYRPITQEPVLEPKQPVVFSTQ